MLPTAAALIESLPRPLRRHRLMTGWMRPDILEAVEKLKPIATEAGVSLAQFSLAWVLREPNVASAIVGASRPEQLDATLSATDLALDGEDKEVCNLAWYSLPRR